jgi:hypothetical protein
MSPTARTVLPTDLVALVSYDGHVYANEALTLDRIGTQDSPHPLEAAFEQWFSFATGRHTWISVKGPTLRGLVSARKRGSKLAWEIDCLIDADDSSGVLMSLLDQVTEAAGKSGALKIFARLPSGSRIERETTRCAFAPYRRETLMRLEGEREPVAPPDGMRRATKADLLGAFHLYNEVVPAAVRRYEAMTLTEFTAAQERLGRTSQYVIEREGRVFAWMRVAGDGDIGRFDLIAREDAADDAVEGVMVKLANREKLYALVPSDNERVRRVLEERGFDGGSEYSVLARRTVRPLKDAQRVPAVARTIPG